MAKHTAPHICPGCGAEMILESKTVRPYKGNKKKWICENCDVEDTLFADHETDIGSVEELCRHNIPADECPLCN